MKLAVLFFGVSKYEFFNWSDMKVSVDYQISYENYKNFIFDFFLQKGYDIDVYFTTNMLDDENKKQICEKYKPIKCNFIENKENPVESRNEKMINVMDLCLESEITYDLILITRFDLLFQKEFDKSNINFDKFNLVSILEKPEYICDNFYLFPYKYLKVFSNICKNNFNIGFHFIQDELYDTLNVNSVNYILNENTTVASLSFYKIVRNFY